jgi:hypothetical protein
MLLEYVTPAGELLAKFDDSHIVDLHGAQRGEEARALTALVEKTVLLLEDVRDVQNSQVCCCRLSCLNVVFRLPTSRSADCSLGSSWRS